MGVDPAQRGRGLATALKSAQAEFARQAGIDIVNWTADPLQWPNAVLNFGRLRAVAFEFLPDYYAFRNDLNRVAASRVALTWLVDSPRVRRGLAGRGDEAVASLASLGARRVNAGPEWESVDIGEARRRVGDRVALQGNLDPMTLFGGEAAIRAEVRRVLADFGPVGAGGHVFNLGHGISQYTPPEAVSVLVDEVHAASRAYHES